MPLAYPCGSRAMRSRSFPGNRERHAAVADEARSARTRGSPAVLFRERLKSRARLAKQLMLLWAGSACGSGAAAPVSKAPPTPKPHVVEPGPLGVSGDTSCPVLPESRIEAEPELIMPDERVPEFRLASMECRVFDSYDLVGKRPFVVVFFASWCSVCEHKMPALRAALAGRAELTALFVSLDDQETWAETEAFLQRHGVSRSAAVAGRDFLGFSLGYNPFRSVPVVVVVGRSGRVVDVQIGVREGDEERLALALDAAIDQAPEEPRVTSYPRR